MRKLGRKQPLSLPATLVVQILFVLYSISVLFSLYFIVINSLKTDAQYAQSAILPLGFSFSNFVTVWGKVGLGKALWNSFKYTTCGLSLAFVCAVLASFAFAFYDFRGKGKLFQLIMFTMYMAPMSIILPLYLQMIDLKLTNSTLGITLIYGAISVSFGVFIITNGFKGVPKEIYESAKMDGASDMRFLIKIVMPITRSSWITFLVVYFNTLWSDLLFGLIFLQKAEFAPAMVVLQGLKGGKYASSFVEVFTGLVIMAIPSILIYTLAQKYFVLGISEGSVKG